MEKNVTISVKVPMCPHCAAPLKKMYINKGVFYICRTGCKSSFAVIGMGLADGELVCKEVRYGRKRKATQKLSAMS